MIVLLLLQGLSGHLDENVLSLYADSLNVPREIVWTVAYLETRQGKQGNRSVGPGTIDTIFVGDTLKVVRKCREIGRMQIRPCGPVPKLFGPRCSPASLREYRNNIYCGVLFLRFLYEKYGSWDVAVERYNGVSKRYHSAALEYLGSLYLKELQHGAPQRP